MHQLCLASSLPIGGGEIPSCIGFANVSPFWRHDQKEPRVISVGDAGGIGGVPTENGENVQNAHLILVADDEIRQRLHTKGSPFMWRSTRCKKQLQCLQRLRTRSGHKS